MTCDEARLSLGALALDGLAETEAAEVRAHLATCVRCQEEYEELRHLPRLLGLVPLGEVVAGPALASAQSGERLLQQVAAERRSDRRRRLARAVSGGLFLAAASATIGFVVADGTAVPAEQFDLALHATDQSTGVWAQVDLREVGWGTKIDLGLTGVEPGETCRLVAVSSDLGEETAGSWTVPSGQDDYFSIPGAIGARISTIDYFAVITSSGETLVEIPNDESAVVTPHED
jgi:hypothetical protein